MSTGYGWEGLRQVHAMLLGTRHVPERLCGGLGCLGRYNKCSPLPFYLLQGDKYSTFWSGSGGRRKVFTICRHDFATIHDSHSGTIGRNIENIQLSLSSILQIYLVD